MMRLGTFQFWTSDVLTANTSALLPTAGCLDPWSQLRERKGVRYWSLYYCVVGTRAAPTVTKLNPPTCWSRIIGWLAGWLANWRDSMSLLPWRLRIRRLYLHDTSKHRTCLAKLARRPCSGSWRLSDCLAGSSTCKTTCSRTSLVALLSAQSRRARAVGERTSDGDRWM